MPIGIIIVMRMIYKQTDKALYLTPRGYTSSFHDASSYFEAANLSDPGLTTRLLPCGLTRLASAPLMRRYLELTGDLQGTEESEGAVRGKCLMEFFWPAPRCRGAEQCFMFFTAGDAGLKALRLKISEMIEDNKRCYHAIRCSIVQYSVIHSRNIV